MKRKSTQIDLEEKLISYVNKSKVLELISDVLSIKGYIPSYSHKKFCDFSSIVKFPFIPQGNFFNQDQIYVGTLEEETKEAYNLGCKFFSGKRMISVVKQEEENEDYFFNIYLIIISDRNPLNVIFPSISN